MNAREIRVAKSDVLRKRLEALNEAMKHLQIAESLEFQVDARLERIIRAVDAAHFDDLKREVRRGILVDEDAIKKTRFLARREIFLIETELKRRGESA